MLESRVCLLIEPVCRRRRCFVVSFFCCFHLINVFHSFFDGNLIVACIRSDFSDSLPEGDYLITKKERGS